MSLTDQPSTSTAPVTKFTDRPVGAPVRGWEHDVAELIVGLFLMWLGYQVLLTPYINNPTRGDVALWNDFKCMPHYAAARLGFDVSGTCNRNETFLEELNRQADEQYKEKVAWWERYIERAKEQVRKQEEFNEQVQALGWAAKENADQLDGMMKDINEKASDGENGEVLYASATRVYKSHVKGWVANPWELAERAEEPLTIHTIINTVGSQSKPDVESEEDQVTKELKRLAENFKQIPSTPKLPSDEFLKQMDQADTQSLPTIHAVFITDKNQHRPPLGYPSAIEMIALSKRASKFVMDNWTGNQTFSTEAEKDAATLPFLQRNSKSTVEFLKARISEYEGELRQTVLGMEASELELTEMLQNVTRQVTRVIEAQLEQLWWRNTDHGQSPLKSFLKRLAKEDEYMTEWVCENRGNNTTPCP